MRVFFSAVELIVGRQYLSQLRAILPQQLSIPDKFDVVAKGHKQRPTLLGKVDPFYWRAQAFPEKVTVSVGLVSKDGMALGMVLSFQNELVLPEEITFRPVVDRHSDKAAQEIIDANLRAGRPWNHGLSL